MAAAREDLFIAVPFWRRTQARLSGVRMMPGLRACERPAPPALVLAAILRQFKSGHKRAAPGPLQVFSALTLNRKSANVFD